MTGLVLGTNCVLQFEVADVYVTYGCAKDFTFEIKTESKQVRTVGDGKWKKTRTQNLFYTLSFSSLIKLNDAATPSSFDTLWAQMNGVHLRFKCIYQEMDSSVLKVIKGLALPVQSSFSATPIGHASSSFTLEGFGAPEILDTLVDPCLAAIASVIVGIGPIEFDLVGVTGSPFRYDYTIDGGATIYTSFTEPFVIAAPGQTAGAHEVIVTPVCVNGLGGTPKTVNYTA